MRTLVVALALLLAGCGDTVINVPTAPRETTPTTTTPVVVRTTIEFRAIGNPTSARVRYSTPIDGLTQLTTSLPYSNSFSTTSDTLFLSLEATPTAYPVLTPSPFFAVQIVVNGSLFREATSNELVLNTLSVSGTWRR